MTKQEVLDNLSLLINLHCTVNTTGHDLVTIGRRLADNLETESIKISQEDLYECILKVQYYWQSTINKIYQSTNNDRTTQHPTSQV